MQKLTRILKALANQRRLAILAYLKKHREGVVSEIAGEIRLSFKATSKHLIILFAANALEREQRSSQMFYRLSSERHPALVHTLSLL